MSDDDDHVEYQPEFVGPCTCDHDTDDHGWSECNIEGCKCEAFWSE
jgi:hypothetical protein